MDSNIKYYVGLFRGDNIVLKGKKMIVFHGQRKCMFFTNTGMQGWETRLDQHINMFLSHSPGAD